mgnify:FL=1
MKLVRREWAENVFSERVKREQVNVIWAPLGAGKTTFVKYMCNEMYKRHFYYLNLSGVQDYSVIDYKLNFVNAIGESISNSMLVIDDCDVLLSGGFMKSILDNKKYGKIILITDDNIAYNRVPPQARIPHEYFQWSYDELIQLGNPIFSDRKKYSIMAKTPAFHLKVLSEKYYLDSNLAREAPYISSLWNHH